jgi:hypothetical protein
MEDGKQNNLSGLSLASAKGWDEAVVPVVFDRLSPPL